MSKTPTDFVSSTIQRLSDKVHEDLAFYVYMLRASNNDEVLYIGKGQGNRLFAHSAEALKSTRQTPKLIRLRELMDKGIGISLVVVRHGLTQKEAFEVEAALIDLFPDALNEMDGHHSATRGLMTLEELVAVYEAVPANITSPSVLININRQWRRALPANPTALYAAVRGDWVIQPRRHRATYAFAVARGIIRQVYTVDAEHGVNGWSNQSACSRPSNQQKHQKNDRYAFAGAVALEMQHFIGQSVAHLQKPGAQNPIRWLHC